jgi:hypothetical protein
MNEFIEFIKPIVGILASVGVIIEISPIKISPLKIIGGWIGDVVNHNMIEKIDRLADKVNVLEKSTDFKDIYDIKNTLSNYHVMLATVGLDENQYRRCFELEDKYKAYKQKYPGEVNGHMEAMLETIHENYNKGNILNISSGGSNEKNS